MIKEEVGAKPEAGFSSNFQSPTCRDPTSASQAPPPEGASASHGTQLRNQYSQYEPMVNI